MKKNEERKKKENENEEKDNVKEKEVNGIDGGEGDKKENNEEAKFKVEEKKEMIQGGENEVENSMIQIQRSPFPDECPSFEISDSSHLSFNQLTLPVTPPSPPSE